MRRIFVIFSYFWCLSAFAANMPLSCPQSAPTSDPHFCSSFKSVTACHCVEATKLPKGMCDNMDFVYQLMKDRFGSIENACQWEVNTSHDTTVEVCVAQWNFYFQKCK
jgi:hypothetical protein